jgi:hypothetical protein
MLRISGYCDMNSETIAEGCEFYVATLAAQRFGIGQPGHFRRREVL